MDIERIVGSSGARIVAAGLCALLAFAIALRRYSLYPWTEGTPFFVFLIVLGICAFIAVIPSFRTLYYRWLAFAEFLQGIVVTVLFGACYLLIVPLFAVIAHALDSSRVRTKSKSFWRPRHPAAGDESYFSRMG